MIIAQYLQFAILLVFDLQGKIEFCLHVYTVWTRYWSWGSLVGVPWVSGSLIGALNPYQFFFIFVSVRLPSIQIMAFAHTNISIFIFIHFQYFLLHILFFIYETDIDKQW